MLLSFLVTGFTCALPTRKIQMLRKSMKETNASYHLSTRFYILALHKDISQLVERWITYNNSKQKKTMA